MKLRLLSLALACILLASSVSLSAAAACFRGICADKNSIGKAASTIKSLERSTQKSMGQLVKKLANLKV